MDNHDALPTIDACWNFSDPAASERSFRELLEQNPDAPAEYRAALWTQLARAQGLQGRFEDAHASVDRAENLSDSAEPRIRVLLERGRIFNSAKLPEQSIELFREAHVLAVREVQDHYAIDALHMLGIAAPPEERLHWNRLAVSLAEDTEDPRGPGWLNSLYNNIGYELMEQGAHAESIEVFEKFHALCRDQHPEMAQIARWFIAKNQRLSGDPATARLGQLELVADHEASGAPSAYVFEELGECALALDNPDEQKQYFARALDLFTTDPQYGWEVENEPERIARIRELSA